ncbi:MAG TPA: DUF805 domain-containing protein [Chitinophagaceae bacterium]|jgi:uncharacterized membrane protein YhaH (DUF805 family)|nr:DUF805 domain-containing protein [Chitinophagaceae bacterium]
MKWFLEVLKKYAVFEGRARRKEYWYFALFYFLFAMLVFLISVYIRFLLLYTFFVLALIIPSIAVGIRRMHDVNKSGWFILIPLYNLILYCTPGTQGPNQYGPDPKNPEFEEFLNEAETVQPQ